MRRPVAFWLLPGEAAMQRFVKCIDDLSARYHAPRFLPHVTLHVSDVARDADLDAALDEVAQRFAPFQMRAGPTGHSPVRFKALFVPLSGGDIVGLANALASEAAPWRSTAGNGGDLAVAYRLEPHLSLLYQVLPEAERARLAACHDCAGDVIDFDRITAVRPAPGAEDFACVEEWVILPPRLLVGTGR